MSMSKRRSKSRENRLETPKDELAWIVGSAMIEVRDGRRRRPEALPAVIVDEASLPDSQNELRDALRTAMSNLSDPERAVVNAAFFGPSQDQSTRLEMAKRLGIGRTKFCEILARAIVSLRAIIEANRE